MWWRGGWGENLAIMRMDENYRCDETIDLEELIKMKELHQSIEESYYTVKTISEHLGIPQSNIYGWKSGRVEPKETSLKNVEKIMNFANEKKRLLRHPSYGYATKEQIDELMSLPPGPHKDQLLSKIKKQNLKSGKS